MAFAGAYEGLGISKRWSRVLKGAAIATAGIAAGYYTAPKIAAFLQSKGFSPAVAQDLANKVMAGKAKLPADFQAEMQATVPPTSPGGDTAWIWPVGVGAAVIGGMFFLMPQKKGRRRRRRY